jgi:hypothetical protein
MYTFIWRDQTIKAYLIILFTLLASIGAAQSKLQLRVHTAHGQVGYDVNSTLISSEKDMIVIDPQFSLSDAHKLAAEIQESEPHHDLHHSPAS